MPPTVFLSYQRESDSKVEAVRQALEADHITCWMDTRALAYGDDWLRMIRQGLQNSHLLVLFLTRACESSDYVKQEVLTAESLGLMILTVRLEDYMPAGDPLNRVNRFHFLDAFNGPIESHISVIVRAVRKKLAERSQAARREGKKAADLLIGSPVADIGNLVQDTWIDGFLLPTIQGLVVKEGHREGINRPYTFMDPQGIVLGTSADLKALPELLNEALGKLVISGERGVGKTILMLQLVRDLLPITDDIKQAQAPLYLNVGSWVDPQKPAHEQQKIKDWIRSRLVKEYHLHWKRADALIKSKGLIYCFDGLDDILDSHYGDTDGAEASDEKSVAVQRDLLAEFIKQVGELASDQEQVVITGGEAVRALVAKGKLPFCTVKIQPWNEENLLDYLDHRGIGALKLFLRNQQEIKARLIRNFSELQMLGTVYQEGEQARGQVRGLERMAAGGPEPFFSAVYDIYLKMKYDRFQQDVRARRVPASGKRSRDKTATLTRGGGLPISLTDITEYAPSLASYISQRGQEDAFRLDTLQPYKLPTRLLGTYRWYAGLLIGAGIALTAGLPVLACILLEALVHHAPTRILALHSAVAVLGYLLAAAIAAVGYRVAGGWKFGLLIGLTFAVGKGFASGCSLISPGFRSGWDAGIHNGLTALVGATPVFAAIMWRIREEPYEILPIETWDPDTGQLLYWILGATGLGALFALGLGWAKGLSFALALGIFAYERFGKKPRLAPVHVRPNQAILYSFKNAIKSGAICALAVGLATGISYGLAYGLPEGPLSGVMAMSAFASVFFFGGLPVAKHVALRKTLRHAGLVSGRLGLWLQMAVNVGLMKQVGGGYVFSSDDARRQYASRWQSTDRPGSGWGESRLSKDAITPETVST